MCCGKHKRHIKSCVIDRGFYQKKKKPYYIVLKFLISDKSLCGREFSRCHRKKGCCFKPFQTLQKISRNSNIFSCYFCFHLPLRVSLCLQHFIPAALLQPCLGFCRYLFCLNWRLSLPDTHKHAAAQKERQVDSGGGCTEDLGWFEPALSQWKDAFKARCVVFATEPQVRPIA